MSLVRNTSLFLLSFFVSKSMVEILPSIKIDRQSRKVHSYVIKKMSNGKDRSKTFRLSSHLED